jgi:hypothetical protein
VTGKDRPGGEITAALLLAAALALAGMALSVSAAVLAEGRTESAERIAYALVLIAVLPAAAVAGSFASRRLGPGSVAWAGTATLWTLVAMLAGLRIAETGHAILLVCVLTAPLSAITILGTLLVTRQRSPDPVAAATWALLALGVGLLVFAHQHAALRPWRVGVAVVIASAAAAWVLRRPALKGGRWIEASLLALVLLLILDVEFHRDVSLLHHQSFYLGPISDLRHGHALLVDNVSQYGVGALYAIAAWFVFVPFGFGTFSILTTLLATGLALIQYFIVRIATGSRSLAFAVIGVITVVTLFGQLSDYSKYPSTGAARFGLPYLLVLVHLLGTGARGGRARATWLLELSILGLAAIWSVETFVYTVTAFGALLAADAVVASGPWLRTLMRRVVQAAGVVVATEIAFTLITRVAAGQWPDWGTYLSLVRRYGAEGFGSLLVRPWSAGIAVAAAFALSVIALLVVAIRARPIAVRNRLAFSGAAGLTAFGVVSYTYFLGRSHPNNVFHVAPSMITMLALWLHIVLREATTAGRPRVAAAAVWATAMGASLAVLPCLPALQEKAQRSALASIVRTVDGHGDSLPDDLQTLWTNPPVSPNPMFPPREPAAQAFLERVGQPGRRVIILLHPDLVPGLLVQTGRANGIPLTTPAEADLSPEAHSEVQEAIAKLRPGAFLIVTARPPASAPRPYLYQLNDIEREAFHSLRARFRLHLVAWDPARIAAFRLDRKRPG